MTRSRSGISTAILRAGLNCFLSGLWSGQAVAAAAQQQRTGKESGGEEGTDGGEDRPFHGVTGLLA